nr:protein-l-isoaspartate o-methyltransferase [Quercus suber]
MVWALEGKRKQNQISEFTTPSDPAARPLRSSLLLWLPMPSRFLSSVDTFTHRAATQLVDRAHFAPDAPYADAPQRLTADATISAPHMHAAAAEALLPFLHPGARVLDVGSGSGYLTLVLALLAQPGGRAVGVEHTAALRALGERNAGKSARGAALLLGHASSGSGGGGSGGGEAEEGEAAGLQFVHADGRRGWAAAAPYDAIHVGAAAAEVHAELVAQLKAPGRLFMPVEEEDGRQRIYVVDKQADGTVTQHKGIGVRYVPLTDAPAE